MCRVSSHKSAGPSKVVLDAGHLAGGSFTQIISDVRSKCRLSMQAATQGACSQDDAVNLSFPRRIQGIYTSYFAALKDMKNREGYHTH